MSIETFNRVEEKYLVSINQYSKMLEYIKKYMNTDKYNLDGQCYTISNIYYDTKDDNLIRTSLLKPRYKEKIRLRAYGVPKMDTKVFLEIKKKYNGVVNKRRSVLELDEAYDFVKSGEMPKIKEYMNSQVLKELDYAIELYGVKPKVYIAYDRRAFFGKDDADLRITFDVNIRTRRENVRLEAGDYGEQLLPEGMMIMEIKHPGIMPNWLIEMLRKADVHKTSFSKYGSEYNKMLKNKLNQNTEVRKYA